MNKHRKLLDILKPKSPKQILEEFSSSHNMSVYELENFVKHYKRDNRILIIILSFFLWTLGISICVFSMVGLGYGYFWLPIHEKSMLLFINIFWISLWFFTALFLIIYGIIILVRAYENK